MNKTFEVSILYVSVFVAFEVFRCGGEIDMISDETNKGVGGVGRGAFDPRSQLLPEFLSPERIRQNPRSCVGELVERPLHLCHESRQCHYHFFVRSCRLHQYRRCPCYDHINDAKEVEVTFNGLPRTVRIVIG